MHSISVMVSLTPFKGAPYLQHNNVFITSTEFMELFNGNMRFAVCDTDYFGGIGEQSALLVEENGSYVEYDSINDALNVLGVIPPHNYESDLFDWCGLGTFRSNEELDEIYTHQTDEPWNRGE